MRLADLTTLGIGGEAEHVLEPVDADALVAAVREVWADGDNLLILGGGSNVVIGDDDFDGTVVRVVTRGIERVAAPAGSSADAVHLLVQAGEPWDDLVAHTVANGWAGIEALSGIPGSSGAAPIQNIGAYGQELKDSLVSIDFLDFLSGERTRIPAVELELDYRTSVLKRERAGLVVAIELRLTDAGSGAGAVNAADGGVDATAASSAASTNTTAGPLSEPIAYAQLASALGVSLGDRVPLATVRETVRSLRASKGMLWDAADPDSISAGSFFTNPIVSENFARGLPSDAPRWPVEPAAADTVVPLEVLPDGADPTAASVTPNQPGSSGPAEYRVKLSAAWLIERAGIGRGFALPGSRAAVSSKHTLALVNRGGATAEEISQLARYIQTRVLSEFGVRLHPEPVLVGLSL